jgi:hypothetical protein
MTRPYGFKPTFNQTFVVAANSTGWLITPYHFGIDQGPVVLALENHRTGLIWEFVRRSPTSPRRCDGSVSLAGGCDRSLLRPRMSE